MKPDNRKNTGKYILYIFCTILLQFTITGARTQTFTLETASTSVKTEQGEFFAFINSVNIDTNIKARLLKFITIEADSIQQKIISDSSIKEQDKIRGIRSLVYVMKGLKENVELQKPGMYDIPGSLDSYKQFLDSMLNNAAYTEVMKPLGQQRSQLLANTFWQCSECSMLNDIATYKRLASAPDYIIPNLEKNPDFYFRDSLLKLAATTNPVKVAAYIERNRNKTALARAIRENQDIYIQQIVALADNKHASDLLPFTEQLAEGKLTVSQIIKERADVNRYFQLLVNTIITKTGDRSNPGYNNALQQAIKEKSLYFYVRSINELHDESDKVRFASVQNMRPEDLFYIITSSADDLYTSSYLGLYNRMMAQLNEKRADSLFELVNFDRFPKFISLAANYNTLGNFLQSMSTDAAKSILEKFLGGIENDTQTGIEKAMDIADIFPVLAPSPEASQWVEAELKNNLNRVTAEQQYFGSKLYTILLQVFDLVKTRDSSHSLWNILGNHEQLSINNLLNDKGEITELVLFYGDKDGVASYNSFIKLFSDSKIWEISKQEQWVTIRSLQGQPIVIYANLPLNNDEQKDLAAQSNLSAFLKAGNIHPSILIHRGHSYHLEHTFKMLEPSMKLVLLGSCGGYNNNLSIANFSPEAQIILSKKVGSKFINDPMINIINNNLLNKKDLVWTDVWNEMETNLKNNTFALSLFNEYIPPSKNVNLFVLKLFNYRQEQSSLTVK